MLGEASKAPGPDDETASGIERERRRWAEVVWFPPMMDGWDQLCLNILKSPHGHEGHG